MHRPSWLMIGGILLLPGAVAGQPVEALPIVAGETDSFFHFDLGNGGGYSSDRLRDPLQIRVRVVSQNLFATIGRPTDQPAVDGEILLQPIFASGSRTGAALLVETSTGYVAFFDDTGDDRLGEMLVAIGRPFAPVKSTDGNFALLMRRDSAGRTEGAYLYHGTSGRGIYLGGLRRLQIDAPVTEILGLPRLAGRVSAAAIQSGRQQTWAYLVVDGGSGEIHFFDLDRQQASRIAVRKSSQTLTEVFPESGPQTAPQRFLAVPVLAADDRTQHVLVLDATSGDLALLEDVDGSRPRLSKAALNLYTAAGLEVSAAARFWEAIPNLSSSGETVGIWLRDSRTSRFFYLGNPAAPRTMTVRPVTTGG